MVLVTPSFTSGVAHVAMFRSEIYHKMMALPDVVVDILTTLGIYVKHVADFFVKENECIKLGTSVKHAFHFV